MTDPVVVEDDFAGVVAESRVEAWSAINELQVEWDEGKLWQQEELEELVTVGGPGGVTIQKEGKVNWILNGATCLKVVVRRVWPAPMIMARPWPPLSRCPSTSRQA